MGIARLDSPDAPLTFVFPETRNPSLSGEPSASITTGFAFARANASLLTSVDFIALKTITSIEPTKTTNSSTTVRQPAGTNHFQFRFHQLGLCVGIAGWVCSTKFFYFNHKPICNGSLDTMTRRDGCPSRRSLSRGGMSAGALHA